MLAGTARLAAAAAATKRCSVTRVERAGAVRAGIRDIRTVPEITVRRNITTCTTLVGLLRHLQHLAELHSLVRLHRLLHVSEPLICHFVYFTRSFTEAPLVFLQNPSGHENFQKDSTGNHTRRASLD